MLGTCAQAQVITMHQVRVDGHVPTTRDPFSDALVFHWFGQPLRLDGARSALLLDGDAGQARLRRHTPAAIARLSRSRGDSVPSPDPGQDEAPGDLILTDGRREWTGQVLRTRQGEILIVFTDGLPPANRRLHIVQTATIAPRPKAARNTICFTPGTRILTEDGPRPIEDLRPGDRVLTRDDGPQEILWTGRHRIPAAKLRADPALRPILIRPGALGPDEPQPDLILSPGHQIMLTGPKARALWGEAEVLVRARDLLDDHGVTRLHGARDVTYIHLLFARHQILWANRVEVESFHPGDADLGHLTAAELLDLLRVAPGADRNASAYGPHARRCLSRAEVAILGNRGAPAYLA